MYVFSYLTIFSISYSVLFLKRRLSLPFDESVAYQACENGLTLGQALQVCCSVVQTQLSTRLLIELRCQAIISMQCNVNNLLSTVAFSKALLSHETVCAILCQYIIMDIYISISF